MFQTNMSTCLFCIQSCVNTNLDVQMLGLLGFVLPSRAKFELAVSQVFLFLFTTAFTCVNSQSVQFCLHFSSLSPIEITNLLNVKVFIHILQWLLQQLTLQIASEWSRRVPLFIWFFWVCVKFLFLFPVDLNTKAWLVSSPRLSLSLKLSVPSHNRFVVVYFHLNFV